MHTAQLDQIIRQKDPQLLQAVEHLAKNETAIGVSMLEAQGRVHQLADTQERIEAIAKSYVKQPDRAIIVSPDNASRRDINQAVRTELQSTGLLSKDDHSMRILTPRSELTAADRTWAARYQTGDILYYTRGSKHLDIERRSYAQVTAVDPRNNLLTVRKPDGKELSYDPSRLRGITAYQELERQFAVGERIQFTAPNRTLGVANRDLGTIERINENGELTVRLNQQENVTFDSRTMPHFDHGYAVTSHSAQGLTTERVLINIDGNSHKDLVNRRLAYVAISRASHDAQIYTDNVPLLVKNLSHQVTKTSAIELDQQHFAGSLTTKTPGAPTPQHSPETPGLAHNITGSAPNQQRPQQQTRLEHNLGLSL
jgi:ATP-dependent exoDNAse (exonuclease V) alpha subunit